MFDLTDDEIAADTLTTPADAALAKVSELATRQQVLEDEVDDLESKTKSKKEELRKLSDDLLPAALAAVGMSSFSLKDGTGVKVKPFYECHISEANREAAHYWLRDNDHADLIKHELITSFGKGEDAYADEAKRALEAMGIEVKDRETVHPSTLKAFVKEQVEAGASIPLETFGAYIGSRAKINRKAS